MMDKDMEIRLLRERLARLERTANAYEASLHTDYVDRLRKRVNVLELALHDVLAALGVAVVPDAASVRALQRHGIGEHRARDVLAQINKKISS